MTERVILKIGVMSYNDIRARIIDIDRRLTGNLYENDFIVPAGPNRPERINFGEVSLEAER